jgi:hypothetical protein
MLIPGNNLTPSLSRALENHNQPLETSQPHEKPQAFALSHFLLSTKPDDKKG